MPQVKGGHQMDEDPDIVVESDWLPFAELQRAVEECRTDFPTALVSSDAPGHRGVDPTIVVAAISGISTIAAPFMAALAARIFAKEPAAAVSLVDETNELVLDAAMDPDARDDLIEAAYRAGARRVRISLPEA